MRNAAGPTPTRQTIMKWPLDQRAALLEVPMTAPCWLLGCRTSGLPIREFSLCRADAVVGERHEEVLRHGHAQFPSLTVARLWRSTARLHGHPLGPADRLVLASGPASGAALAHVAIGPSGRTSGVSVSMHPRCSSEMCPHAWTRTTLRCLSWLLCFVYPDDRART